MKILAFSDVSNWDPYKELVDKWKPPVVTLAGDLTSDGGAEFWQTALEAIPAFRRDIQSLQRRLGVTTCPREGYAIIPANSVEAFARGQQNLKQQYRVSRGFLKARKRIHVDKFYSFLRYAGKQSTVLVVKGDHDDDFANDYSARKIDAIPGCVEISGKLVVVNGFSFFGVGFDQACYRRTLRRLICERGPTDFVVAHAPQRNVRLLAELRPRLLIRGHFGNGTYSVDGVPSIFTAGCDALISVRGKGHPHVEVFNDGSWGRASEGLLRRSYPWLLPYPR